MNDVKEYKKQYYLKNKEKFREYYLNNREKIIAKANRWKENNPERVKYYRKNNVDKYKNNQLKCKYKISLDDYNRMFAEQKGLCAICNNSELSIHNNTGKIMRLAVDHDHKTGKVRGLLCGQCNQALGKFKDDSELILKAYNYLKENT